MTTNMNKYTSLICGKDNAEIESRCGEYVDEYWPNAKAFHINEHGLWVAELKDGKFHVMLGNDDDIVDTIEQAFELVNKAWL